MSHHDDKPNDPRHPNQARGEHLADGAGPAGDEEAAAEQARHPGLARGDELAHGDVPDPDVAHESVQQAKHPGGVRGEDLAEDA